MYMEVTCAYRVATICFNSWFRCGSSWSESSIVNLLDHCMPGGFQIRTVIDIPFWPMGPVETIVFLGLEVWDPKL